MDTQLTSNFLKRTEIFKCFMSYLADLSLALLPMMIWNVTMLAVFGSLLPMSGLDTVNEMTMNLITITAALCSNVMILLTKGKTMGMMIFNLRIANKNGERANLLVMLLREIIYFTVPFIYFINSINVYFLLGYMAINFIFMMVDKKRRLPIDLICQTCLVNDKNEVAVPTKKPQEPKVVGVKTNQTPQPIEIKSEATYDKIDLHIHSNFSPRGKLSVEEIFIKAKEKGVETISITDMNCVKADAMAKKMSDLYGVKYVSGIEIEAQSFGKPINVLGYGIDTTHELYATLENESIMNEQNASRRRCALFEKYLDKTIALDGLLENNKFQRVTGGMLAIHVLSSDEYKDCALLANYREGTLEENAKKLVSDYFVMGKPCYVEKNRPTLQDVLQIIELSGGVAVIANPNSVLTRDPSIFNQAASNPLVKGLEVFRSDYTNETMMKLIKLAKEKELLLTCGSDFYGVGNKEIGKCNLVKNAETIVEGAILQITK